MEWGSHPYTTACRFTTDPAEPPGRIIWYVTHLPFLDVVTTINSRYWDTDAFLPRRLGEQPDRSRTYNGRWSVPGLTAGHYCGTLSQFFDGYSTPLIDPQPPGPNGIPACCPRAQPGQVAAGIAPMARVVHYHGYTDAPAGGVRIGGRVAEGLGYTDAAQGGVRIGGQGSEGPAYTDPAQGGVRVGGQVLDVLAYTDPAQGGVRVGGQVPDVLAYTDAAQGGVRVGGQVPDVLAYTDPAQGGVRVGGEVLDVLAYTDPAQGGVRVGGQVPDVLAYTDPAQGGVRVGGQVPDVLAYTDAAQGGVRVGGLVLDRLAYTDAAQGGVRVGGLVLDRLAYTDAAQGGVRIGGQVVEQLGYADSAQGGFRIGGQVGSGVLGTISTTGGTGGPVVLVSNITFAGGGSVTLSVTGQTITFAGSSFDSDSRLVNAVNVLTGTGGLLSGTLNLLVTTGNPNFTLPAQPTVGDVVEVVVDPSSTGTVVINNTISGVSGKVLHAGEAFTCYYTGSTWKLRSYTWVAMAASMYQANGDTGQSIGSGAGTPITLDTTVYDSTGAMASSGSHNITVPRPGLYLVSGSAGLSGNASNTANLSAPAQRVETFIVSSGSANTFGAEIGTTQGQPAPTATRTVQCVAGEQFSLAVFQNSGSPQYTVFGTTKTWLTVTEVSGAKW